jgi:hypothetical protein
MDSSNKDSNLVSLNWNSSTFAWQRVKSLQYLAFAPLISSPIFQREFCLWVQSCACCV